MNKRTRRADIEVRKYLRKASASLELEESITDDAFNTFTKNSRRFKRVPYTYKVFAALLLYNSYRKYHNDIPFELFFGQLSTIDPGAYDPRIIKRAFRQIAKGSKLGKLKALDPIESASKAMLLLQAKINHHWHNIPVQQVIEFLKQNSNGIMQHDPLNIAVAALFYKVGRGVPEDEYGRKLIRKDVGVVYDLKFIRISWTAIIKIQAICRKNVNPSRHLDYMDRWDMIDINTDSNLKRT